MPVYNAERNRKMLAAFEAGTPIEVLADEFGLTDQYVRVVLTAERHKRQLSLDPFYQALRQQR